MSDCILIANVSDVHAGSSVAVCPPEISLDDGGMYVASKAQRWLWQNWGDYWERVARRRDELNADLYCVFNGDLVEGDHHGTTQILSGNPTAQAAALNACMKSALALGPSKMFFVRGTEAHVGKSGCHEERIALGLQKDGHAVEGDPDTGTASWWHLRLELFDTLVDVAHHGRTGQREHTRAGAAALHAHDILLSHVKQGHRYPDLCLRAHYHRFNDSYDACPVRVVTSGAWQLKTSYVHKVAADSLADIGGLIVTVRPDGYAVEKVHYRPERGRVWRKS